MLGTFIDVAGILIGGLAAWAWRRPLAPARQLFLKVVLGVFTVWIGLKVTVTSLNGQFWQVSKQVLLLLLALMVGRLLGRLLHLQKSLNHLGRLAKDKLAQIPTSAAQRRNDGFLAATILFCGAPLAIPGAIQDGLTLNFQPLLLKAVLDALLTMALVPTFGWTVLLAAVPMAALQLSVGCGAQWLEPLLRTHGLIDSVGGVCGILIFCVALLVFEIRKVEWADYLPALILAPLLTWLWR